MMKKLNLSRMGVFGLPGMRVCGEGGFGGVPPVTNNDNNVLIDCSNQA